MIITIYTCILDTLATFVIFSTSTKHLHILISLLSDIRKDLREVIIKIDALKKSLDMVKEGNDFCHYLVIFSPSEKHFELSSSSLISKCHFKPSNINYIHVC